MRGREGDIESGWDGLLGLSPSDIRTLASHLEEPGCSWVKHGYCHHRYCHSLKINASLRCPLGKPAHVDCCGVCVSPAQGRSPKAKKHMLQTF